MKRESRGSKLFSDGLSVNCRHGYTHHRLAEEVEGWSEAERHGAATGAEWASRRSEAEGLDRSATLGAEKRPTEVKG